MVTRLGLHGGARGPYGSFGGKVGGGGGGTKPFIEAFTRLGLYGGARSPYGSFTKGVAVGTKPFTEVFTRLGLYGAMRFPYGSFLGKEQDLTDDGEIFHRARVIGRQITNPRSNTKFIRRSSGHK